MRILKTLVNLLGATALLILGAVVTVLELTNRVVGWGLSYLQKHIGTAGITLVDNIEALGPGDKTLDDE